jgi:hypothetical protein
LLQFQKFRTGYIMFDDMPEARHNYELARSYLRAITDPVIAEIVFRMDHEWRSGDDPNLANVAINAEYDLYQLSFEYGDASPMSAN